MIMRYSIKKIAGNLQLGEGCIWDEIRNKVHFLDIEGYKIYSYSLDTQQIEEIDMGDYIGCIVLDESNRLIAAVKNKLVRINLETREQEVLVEINQPSFVRFNDGKCDKYGNLWVGTMAIDQSHPKAEGAGKLYCIKDKKILSEYSDFTIANGLDWDEEKKTFYHIDTITQQISVYDSFKEGIIGNRRVFVQIEESEGAPDGMCVDAIGNLWVAMWGGSKVNCYDSQTGKKLNEVLLPDKNVSCCTFGGEKMDTLYVTTAQDENGNFGGIYEVLIEGNKGKQGFFWKDEL